MSIALLLAVLSIGVPHTETIQTVSFPGVRPNAQYLVQFTVSHYEGDPFPYTLGTTAFSNAAGTARTNVAMDELGANYPVYEVSVCIYNPWDVLGLAPLECTPDTYVGYSPDGYLTQ